MGGEEGARAQAPRRRSRPRRQEGAGADDPAPPREEDAPARAEEAAAAEGAAAADAEGADDAAPEAPEADEPEVAQEPVPRGASKSDAKAAPGKKRGPIDPLDEVVWLMKERQFGKAAAMLQKLLQKQKDDPVLLHNLGVVYTEQGMWPEAEDTFMAAFEAQKKAGSLNYATLFGLGTVLTEQGGMGKLLQAEALFRDCLQRAIKQEENGVIETYRAFTSLAENLSAQKRWKDAAEAYTQSLELGLRMFGEQHPHNMAQRALLERAKRLGRLQKYMRAALWTGTAAVPVVCAWLWARSTGTVPGAP